MENLIASSVPRVPQVSDIRLKNFFAHIIHSAEEVAGNPATNLPEQSLNAVKTQAFIDLLENLNYAVRYAEEAKELSRSDEPEDKSYLREVLTSYSKAQVEVAMNLNAIKAQVEEIVS